MRSSGGQVLIAAALALLVLALTTALHYEGLKILVRPPRGRLSRRGLVYAISALVALHLAEIGLYAAAYAAGTGPLDLGALRGTAPGSALDLFYFAAETYSTVGYGDVVPNGALRLLASVEPLNGLLLLAWSGAFLFRLLEEREDKRTEQT
jgi:hypothetical protein